MGPQRAGQFHPHVAQTTDPDHADLHARPDFPVTQGRPCGDAGAQKRSHGGQLFGAVRHLQHEIVLDHDALGIAAQCMAGSICGFGTIGVGHAAFAELFQPLVARVAGFAAVDHTADAHDIAFLEAADGRADVRDAADDLVAGDAGKADLAPLAAHRMQVRVADAAIVDLDLHIMGTDIAARNGDGFDGAVGGGGTIGFDGHDAVFRF